MMEVIIIFMNYSKIMLKMDNLYETKFGFEFINIIYINVDMVKIFVALLCNRIFLAIYVTWKKAKR
jgi:hypothetical protein